MERIDVCYPSLVKTVPHELFQYFSNSMQGCPKDVDVCFMFMA